MPVNVNVAGAPAHTVEGAAVNVEVGALTTLIVWLVVDEQAPDVKVSVTVFVPVVLQETL